MPARCPRYLNAGSYAGRARDVDLLVHHWRAGMAVLAGGVVGAAWPGPPPRPARVVEAWQPENEACPYSGKPVTHLLETDGRVFGFCNATCRDKTVNDPDAWPDFVALRDAAPQREK